MTSKTPGERLFDAVKALGLGLETLAPYAEQTPEVRARYERQGIRLTAPASLGEERLVKEMEYANSMRNMAALFYGALREIAYLRPGGPSRNKVVEQMERIAINALDKAAALSPPPTGQATGVGQ